MVSDIYKVSIILTTFIVRVNLNCWERSQRSVATTKPTYSPHLFIELHNSHFFYLPTKLRLISDLLMYNIFCYTFKK